jgi:serine protease
MRYRSIAPAFALSAALVVSGCGPDDTAGTYDTVPPATETTAPGAAGTTPGMTTPGTTAPGTYDPAMQPGMTADTAWGADTVGVGATGTTPPRP